MQAIHLFINIAATMVLGCSNTYQQLVTALKVDEIRWVLQKRGDSKVGTNSPWSINHKRKGKTVAWLAWLLLILTSVVSDMVDTLQFLLLNECVACPLPGKLRNRPVVLYSYAHNNNIYRCGR